MTKDFIFLPSLHSFCKMNGIQKIDKDGLYDLLCCTKCSIKGKKYKDESCINLLKTYPVNTIKFCTMNDNLIGKKIKIIQCFAIGALYNGCKQNTIHTIIDPPFGQSNDEFGVWINGNGRPVKVMYDEFTFYNGIIRTNKSKFKRTK